jgi:CBS domain-containing protein
MNIGQILNSKGHDVVTIDESAPLTEAVEQLARRNIGSLVVRGAAGVAGIISERDVIRVIYRHGRAVLDTTVKAAMTANPTSCSPETTLDQALEIMTAGRFRHLPVMRGGQLSGIISIGDVVKAKIDETEREAAELRDYIAK